MKHLKLILLAAAIIISGCTERLSIVKVEGGQIEGVPSGTEGVIVYKGIPFAAPPVGDLRWKAPQPVVPWEGVKLCDEFGNAAYQAAHNPGDFYQKEFFDEGDAPYSEDCLYLNVWAPAKKGKKLPVAMWIHGGGYSAGWGFEKEMDGEAWAERGVILVTINYRLGIFGFMAHPELSADSENGVSGNYGILDQIAALKWIKNNIAAFGGDPDNITIFGQSAGAGSVRTLVTSDLSKDLIAKAIIMSGGGVSDRAMLSEGNLARAEAMGKDMMDMSGLNTLPKMREASTETIYKAALWYTMQTGNFMPFSPIIDGYLLKEGFVPAAFGNRIADVPYMIGGCLDDLGTLGSMEDIGRFCALSDGDRYAYHFERKLPGDDAGAFHSSELWYVFHTLSRSWRPFEPADEQLSQEMVDAWTSFAATGNPGWEPYTSSSPYYKVFNIK